MSYRILHTADIHLDRPFGGNPGPTNLPEARRRGLREALSALGTLARTEECDAISIGGDLFEDELAGYHTARFLVDTFRSFAPRRVFISPGNHDPFHPRSLYARTNWPSNVHIFRKQEFEPVTLEEGLTLWGIGHPDVAWRTNPLDTASVPKEGVHIALFHGAEMGSRPKNKGIHGPFSASEIHQHGFLLALLGHYHDLRIDEPLGLIYPGTPEPLASDETGDRGPVLVTIEKGKWHARSIPTNQWLALDLRLPVDGAMTTAEVIGTAISAIRDASPRALSKTMVRLSLTGRRDDGLSLSPDLLAQISQDLEIASLSVVDMTQSPLDPAVIMREPTVRGAFLRQLEELSPDMEEEEREELIARTRAYGLDALSDREILVP